MSSPHPRLALAVLLMMTTAARAQSPRPPQRKADFIPKAWTTFPIQWKPTWDQTLAANPDKAWRDKLFADKTLRHAAETITKLRKIEFLKAMIARFPADKAQHRDAWLAIAREYTALGMTWWAADTGWTMARAFPGDKAVVADAYYRMLSWDFGSQASPDARQWEFAAPEAMALIESGTIEAKTPAFNAACTAMNDLITRQRRYDRIGPHLERLEKLAATTPAARAAAVRLLAYFGHSAKAAGADEVSGFGKYFELETRFTAMLGGFKLRGGGPVSADDVQSVLDLAARSDALGAVDGSHYQSFAVMVDQVLGALPPESLQAVRATQSRAAAPLATAVRLTGDRDELSAASRRYPWATGLHRLLLDFGEQDLLAGRKHWAIAAFRDVIGHSADPKLRAAARVGLWLALAQSGNTDALKAAMAEVPQIAQLPWRGAAITAGALKREILSQMPTRGSMDAAAVTAGAAPRDRAISHDGRRVYRLLDGSPAAIAALDARTGRTVWSTRSDAQWQSLRPTSFPAAAEGRVYVLAVSTGDETMWHLACLSGATGQTFWTQRLGWNDKAPRGIRGASAGVAVAGGAVYCSTHSGLVARCDVRDGTVAWVRAYAGAVNSAAQSPHYNREGSGPVIDGHTLLLAPRDHSGVLALEAASGKQRWVRRIIPSDRVLGAAGGTLVTMNDSWLCALDVETGNVRWMRRFEQPIGTRAAISGTTVAVISGGKLLRLATDTGKTLGESAIPPVPDAPKALPAITPVRPASAIGDQPLTIPLEEVWMLPGDKAALLPPDAQAPSGDWCLQSGPNIACIQTSPRWQIAWQRGLPSLPQRVVYDGRDAIVAAGSELRAYSTADGTLRWSLRLDFQPARLGAGEGLVYAATGGTGPLAAAVVDAATGKLLWCRTLDATPRTRGVPVGMGLHPEGSGVVLTVDWPLVLFANLGWQQGRMIVDARGGQIRELQLAPGGLRRGPEGIFCSLRTARFNWREMWTPVAMSAPDPAAAAKWNRWINGFALVRYPEAHSFRTTPRGLYACAMNELFFFDPKTQRETVYTLPMPGAPRVTIIYAVREVGRTLLVVAGHTDERITLQPRERRILADPALSTVRVHAFDLLTGRHLAVQTLPGIPSRSGDRDGFQTQAFLIESALVVTAPDGVHVFRRQGAPAAPFAKFAEAVRGLDGLGARVEPAALARAHSAATRALAEYGKSLGAAKLTADQRKEILDEAAVAIRAARGQYLQPILTPPPGGQLAPSRVAISTRLIGTQIRYSLDGSDPAVGGHVYSRPIALTGKVQVKAVADLPGKIGASSPTVGGEYRPLTAQAAKHPGPVNPGLAWAWRTGRHAHVSEVFTASFRTRGTSKNFDVSPWYSTDAFAVLFTGYIRIPADGAYTFFVSSDDGSQLYIGDTLVVDNDKHHPVQMVRGEIALRAGLHPLRLGYFEEVGGEVLRVEYAGPGIDRQDIPDSILFHKP